MREVTIKQNDTTTVTIKSPWLNINNAANYLGISRTEFYLHHADKIPFKGLGAARRYHTDELDKYDPVKPAAAAKPKEKGK